MILLNNNIQKQWDEVADLSEVDRKRLNILKEITIVVNDVTVVMKEEQAFEHVETFFDVNFFSIVGSLSEVGTEYLKHWFTPCDAVHTLYIDEKGQGLHVRLI